MPPEVPLTGADVIRFLEELAVELPSRGPQHVVTVVGGALRAVRGLRASTLDVDSIRALDLELVNAAGVVAPRHGLSAHWLNDSARAFLPATFDEAACDVLVDQAPLRVLGAPIEQVFVMKLFAGRVRDNDDLIAMWPSCRFASPADAVELCERAYPAALEDPYLLDHITTIARLASDTRE